MDASSRYDSLIAYYAEKYGRNPKQIKRQIRAESNFNPSASNPRSGARGLMQFMKATWLEWGTYNFDDAYDPELSIAVGCKYLRWLECQLASLEIVLAAYNYGIGNVQKGKSWPKETKSYVKKCMAYEEETMVC